MKGNFMLRHIIPEVWKRVRLSALRQGISVRDWVWQAVLAKLSKEGGE